MKHLAVSILLCIGALCCANDCPTFLSGGTALIDAATVAKLAGGTWEHTKSEIIIKADPEVHCPFCKREYYTDQAAYPTSGASLYFSWLDVGLVPVRILELYSWSVAWNGATGAVTAQRGDDRHEFHILRSWNFFARYGAQPRPDLPPGPNISYVCGDSGMYTGTIISPLLATPNVTGGVVGTSQPRTATGGYSTGSSRTSAARRRPIAGPGGGKTVYVRSYTRKDGTRVRSHYRRPPRR